MKPKLTFANAVALLALFISLGGTVYAAAKINGKTIKVGSIPANRLQPDSIGGEQVGEAALGTVPTAARADRAESAIEAERAKHVPRAESAALASKADEALKAAFAAEADEAEEAGLVPLANDAVTLGGLFRSDYGRRCDDGTVKGYVLFDARANQKVRAFNCAEGAVTVEDIRPGIYKVTFANLMNAEMGIASSAGTNTEATAGRITNQGPQVFEVFVGSTNQGQVLPDEPFALMVF